MSKKNYYSEAKTWLSKYIDLVENISIFNNLSNFFNRNECTKDTAENTLLKCHRCNTTFLGKKYFDLHMKSHSEISQIIWEICHIRIKNSKHFKTHLRAHDVKKDTSARLGENYSNGNETYQGIHYHTILIENKFLYVGKHS